MDLLVMHHAMKRIDALVISILVVFVLEALPCLVVILRDCGCEQFLLAKSFLVISTLS